MDLMKLGVNIAAAVSGQREVDRLKGSLSALEGSVSTLRSAFYALGGTAAVYGLVRYSKSVIDAADSMNDLRQRTGVAVEDLDALGFAAEQNGTSLDAVSSAISKMVRLMGDAAGGNLKATTTLRQFGISVDEIKNGSLTATEALARIAERISQMPDGIAKGAAANAVFGKSWMEIVPLLNAGGDAVRNAKAQLQEYGALMSTDLAMSADEFNDKVALLNRVLGGIALNLARELLPVLDLTAQGFLDAGHNADTLGGNTSIQDWAEGGALAIASLVDFVRMASESIRALFLSLASGNAGTEYMTVKYANPANWFKDDTPEMKRLLDERNRLAAEADQAWLDVYNMNTTKVYDAVKARFDAQRVAPGKTDKGGETTSTSRTVSDPNWNFDLGAGAAAEKAAAAQKKLGAERAQQLKQLNEYRIAQEGENALLELEAQKVNMSAHEYDMLVESKRHEIELQKATAGMLPEVAAQYEKVADSLFAARQAIEEYNYEQSRTFSYGAKEAFREYLDEATNAADQSKKLFSDAFSGMEDALVGFVKTGKLDFSGLVDSILDDLARIVVQQAIMAPLLQAFGLGGGTAGSGGLLGSIFGFAKGGVMTGKGPVELRQAKSKGGVERSPKVAMYAEGGVPEAFVPLADGRSIPVTVSGLPAAAPVDRPVVFSPSITVGSPDLRPLLAALGSAQRGRAAVPAAERASPDLRRPVEALGGAQRGRAAAPAAERASPDLRPLLVALGGAPRGRAAAPAAERASPDLRPLLVALGGAPRGRAAAPAAERASPDLRPLLVALGGAPRGRAAAPAAERASPDLRPLLVALGGAPRGRAAAPAAERASPDLRRPVAAVGGSQPRQGGGPLAEPASPDLRRLVAALGRLEPLARPQGRDALSRPIVAAPGPTAAGRSGRGQQEASGGESPIQIIVNNHTQSQVQVRESRDARGSRRAEVIIGDAAAAEVRRNGSSLNQALRSTFQTQPALTGR